jgi:glycosyltransferase involved in cell wall biosynthesis
MRLPARVKADTTSQSSHRRLWMVNHYAGRPEQPGGTRHLEMASVLATREWETTIYAAARSHSNYAFSHQHLSLLHPSCREEIDGIGFEWLHSTTYDGNNWRRYGNMLSFVAAFMRVAARRPRPDVVMGSSPHPPAAIGAMLIARCFRVPFVLEVRDVWPDTLVQLGLTSPLVIRPLLWMERTLYARAVRIVALTDGIAERIVAKGVPAEKLVVVPNGSLPPPPLDPERRDKRRRDLGWDGRVVAIWAGAHGPSNGLDVVIDAARLLADKPEILVVFIGDGPLKKSLIAQAADLPNVQFLEPMAKTEIGEIVRAADIGLLHARRFDAFTGARPNKLFDYFSAALPIISTIPGEAWRLVDEAKAGLHAEWENPAALAAAVAELAADPERRAAMGRRGYDQLSQSHSREAAALRLGAVLDELVAATGRGVPAADERVEAGVRSPGELLRPSIHRAGDARPATAVDPLWRH